MRVAGEQYILLTSLFVRLRSRIANTACSAMAAAWPSTVQMTGSAMGAATATADSASASVAARQQLCCARSAPAQFWVHQRLNAARAITLCWTAKRTNSRQVHDQGLG